MVISSLIPFCLLPLVPVPECLNYILDISTWLCHSCLKTKVSQTVFTSLPFKRIPPLTSVNHYPPSYLGSHFEVILAFFSLSSSYTDTSFRISSVSVSVTTQM